MFNILLLPRGQLIKSNGQATLLDILVAGQIPIGHSCAGEAVCGWCKVKFISGLENYSPPTGDELHLRRYKELGVDERLACQVWVESDLTITTSYW